MTHNVAAADMGFARCVHVKKNQKKNENPNLKKNVKFGGCQDDLNTWRKTAITLISNPEPCT